LLMFSPRRNGNDGPSGSHKIRVVDSRLRTIGRSSLRDCPGVSPTHIPKCVPSRDRFL
jgi:hypothetical protein